MRTAMYEKVRSCDDVGKASTRHTFRVSSVAAFSRRATHLNYKSYTAFISLPNASDSNYVLNFYAK
jgi:hypothetical protein